MYPMVIPVKGSFWLMKDLIIDLPVSPSPYPSPPGGEGICLGARGLVRGRGDL